MKFISKVLLGSAALLAFGSMGLPSQSDSVSLQPNQAHASESLFSTFKKANYLGKPIEVIDIHMHSGSFETMGPLGRSFLLRSLPGFIPDFLKEWSLTQISKVMLDPYGAFIGIKSECEGAGLSACGLFAVHAPETWGVTTNEKVISQLEDRRNRLKGTNTPYFFGLASVSMQDWDTHRDEHLANLRTSLENSFIKGIKLAFIHNTVPLDDRTFDEIYHIAAEKNTPVYHHVGSSPLRDLESFPGDEEREKYLRSYDPRYLENVISDFPDVPFILGHMGFDFNKEGFDFSEEVYSLAKKYPNVYLEISAFGRASYDPDGKFMDSVLRRLKQENLLTRTIYGSDGPGVPGSTKKYIESTLKSLERTGYSFEEAELILAHNAKKIFKLSAQ